MARKRDPLGGGIFLVIGIFTGIAVGSAYGEPSFGLTIGLGIGALVAIAVTLFQRR